MDYIEGRHLESVIREYGAQDQGDVIEWAKQLCDVLSYLHSRKPPIIYRDMKPSNVMLRPDGKVMLIDFGTAREFKETSVADTTCLGNSGLCSAKDMEGTDRQMPALIFIVLGLHCTICLQDTIPASHLMKCIPSGTGILILSSGLEEIILKCTQKNPDDRYQFCGELLYALEHYNELDIEYKKKQNLKWHSFLAVSITVLAGAGAIGFKVVENSAKASTYEAYVSEAENLATTDPEKCMEYYENAIILIPAERLMKGCWISFVAE